MWIQSDQIKIFFSYKLLTSTKKVILMQILRTRQIVSNFIKRKFHNDYPYIKFHAEKDNFSRCSSHFRTQALIPFVVEQTVNIHKENGSIYFVNFDIYFYLLLNRQEENDHMIYFLGC
jgi:hypothetical protein